MSPPGPAIDGQGALVIAAVNMTVGPDVISVVERIAQFSLRNQLYLPVVACDYFDHDPVQSF